ncbi:SAM-dependent methyltransferase TehB [Acinetobacter wuhouensis]|uniref:SAM-dependent methyltransferase TehB n=1 Tax=Acinetobacter wuhouensis TaxID=1879050 RepID=A0A4Q7ANY5_9GAMM|nr:SAM-dependent methyltransferase TehB [Acinetobacter wuhouensis]RZG48768.1 SAM-dependent methyltransferase TehB [Acinetobacter wuhouensis]RZG69457.1 SAM-dependent methyltransferase TehB [Acinetobacter wuhouensis]
MENLRCYRELPIWDAKSIPQGFKQAHNTKVGTWAKLNILQGHLDFAMLNEHGDTLSQYPFSVENQPPFITPQAWHKIVSTSPDVRCQLSFYCEAEDYFAKRYQLSPTHSEILMAMPYLNTGKALDVGCGLGRNTLYLNQHGFQVDAFDVNPQSIQKLNDIIEIEKLENIQTAIRDLNQDQSIDGAYDFVFSTVVMMFLQAETIPPLIQNMQKVTKTNGVNLIVCAMDTDDYPVQSDFPFSFKPQQLRDYYRTWNILKYNENVGELHRTDEQGNRIKQRFATLLAQKI